MNVGEALRTLAEAVDGIEAEGNEVVDVSLRDHAPGDEEGLAVDLTTVLPVIEGTAVPAGVEVRPTAARVTDDDRVAVELSVSVPPEPGATDGEGATARAGGETVAVRGHAVSRSAAVELDEAADEERDAGDGGDSDGSDDEDGGPGETGATDETKAADESGGDDADDEDGTDEPAYRDPERLRAVYEAHDSFPQMRDALGVDVTPQTVRRQMIEHGIHVPERSGGDGSGDGERDAGGSDEPNEDGGADVEDGPDGDADDGDDARVGEEGNDGDEADGEGAVEESAEEEPPAADAGRSPLADGMDLPESVALDDVKRVVASARTLHEVERDLGVERDRARRLLSELDLLDLVTGRLAARRDEVSMQEIEARIDGAAPSTT